MILVVYLLIVVLRPEKF
ncbi:MAG: potassium-transporting ATPase subunit F [Syntrophales bacterium]